MKKSYLYILLLIPLFLAYFPISDGPNSWTQLLSGATVFNDAIAINPTNSDIIYAGTNGAGVYQTTNGGVNWTQVNGGLTDLAVQTLTISNSSPTTLYAGCITGGVFKTTNSGANWTQVNTGITEVGKNVQAIAVKTNDPNTAVTCLFDGVNNATVGVYKTTNGGTSWVPSIAGIGDNKNFLSMATNAGQPNTVYLGSSFSSSPLLGVHIYKSFDFGTNWQNISNGIDTSYVTLADPVRDISISTVDSNRVFIGRFFNSTNGGPWLTTNAGANWFPILGGLPTTGLIRSVKIKPGSNTEFYIGGNGAGAVIGGVFKTTNAGTNWFSFNSGAMDSTKTIRSLNFRLTPDVTLYAGCAAGTIGSTPTGVFAYTFVPPPPPPNKALLLPTPGVNTNYVLVPYQSSMAGITSVTIEAWLKIGGITTANTVLNKGGASFDYQLGINATTANPFFRAQGIIVTCSTVTMTPVWTHLAVTSNGNTVTFYRNGVMVYTQTTSSPLGTSANEIRIGRGNSDAGSGDIEELRLWSVARSQGQIDSNKCIKYPSGFIGGTTGLKAIWHFDSTYTDSLSGWNGTPQGTVGFDTVSFPIPGADCTIHFVGIEKNGNNVPTVYSLDQNYPNPFNPSTTIRFGLPKGEFVEMVLYDILGRKVATLVKEPKQAGVYEIKFDAQNLATGVYFYKLTAGDFTAVKKMLLIK
jgi:photosystem II stability/assembly factor-like uncharacterized protein